MDATARQRDYYQQTAADYDAMHLGDAAHTLALQFLASTLDSLGVQSVLDVGAGTGRVLSALADRPQLKVVGVEPVAELREVGRKKGIPATSLIDGDVYRLPFADNSFDVVCAFGVMHHLADPDRGALEMVRVARRAIFISDHNDPGRGTAATKAVKRLIKAARLWGLFKSAVTRGRGYRITDDDGVWYPYSILDTHKTLSAHCSRVHFLGSLPSGPNLYGASHIAMLGLKDLP
jgi:ubiquinone/menaquinone biosynthesis C-methylase UbiE